MKGSCALIFLRILIKRRDGPIHEHPRSFGHGKRRSTHLGKVLDLLIDLSERWAGPGIRCPAGLHQLFDILRPVALHHRSLALLHNKTRVFVDIIVLKGLFHCQQLPEKNAKRKNIDGKAVGFAEHNLGCHVTPRPGQPRSLVLVEANAVTVGKLLS